MLLAMTTGPELVAIIPNAGNTLDPGDVLDVAPREFLIRFNDGQDIDAGTLDGIQTVRSGGDGVFGNANDVTINYGWAGLADESNEVIVRFAETLPDDHYEITIYGTGATPLENAWGVPFLDGGDFSLQFELDLGAQIVSVVPQPFITRAFG